MKTSDLVFIGIKGSVISLNRATGEQVWAARLQGSEFVNVVLQQDAVFASCNGEIFCLDPLTGNPLWHNSLKGFGRGLATLAVDGIPSSASAAVLAEKRRRDEQASAAASSATM